MTSEQRGTTLAEWLAAVDAGDDARTEALVALLSPANEDALLVLAGPPDGDRRWWAVRALAAVGGGSAVPALLAALESPDAGTRAAAALALGHLCTRCPAAVVPHLDRLAQMLADDDGFVRRAAGDGLSLCGDDAVPPLVRVLSDSQHEGARTRAAAALRNIRTTKAAAALYRCLNDHNHLVHTYAYEGLDEMGLLENLLLWP
jgi:HEAT repeat protein